MTDMESELEDKENEIKELRLALLKHKNLGNQSARQQSTLESERVS